MWNRVCQITVKATKIDFERFSFCQFDRAFSQSSSRQQPTAPTASGENLQNLANEQRELHKQGARGFQQTTGASLHGQTSGAFGIETTSRQTSNSQRVSAGLPSQGSLRHDFARQTSNSSFGYETRTAHPEPPQGPFYNTQPPVGPFYSSDSHDRQVGPQLYPSVSNSFVTGSIQPGQASVQPPVGPLYGEDFHFQSLF